MKIFLLPLPITHSPLPMFGLGFWSDGRQPIAQRLGSLSFIGAMMIVAIYWASEAVATADPQQGITSNVLPVNRPEAIRAIAQIPTISPSTLPPAVFPTNQTPAVSVPPLQSLPSQTLPPATIPQPSDRPSESVSPLPSTSPVIEFGQPLPKTTPENPLSLPQSTLPVLEPDISCLERRQPQQLIARA